MTDLAAETPVARAAPSPAVQLVALRKAFGEVVAVDGVDLSVGEGEFFSMLGPSGSGKTTVLRMVAGFERPTGGAILLRGRDVTGLAPYDRDVNTVFQDYALFPHMSVMQNVEYGPKVKRVPRSERRRRAGEALETVRLSAYANRKPSQLSGGQRQRVALARALVNRPKVLLLDEPLGALDLKLREEMQVELKAIQHRVGITFVFVTHDQHEALSMSDRIAVFNLGRVEQVGTPQEIYERPATAFVAGFVGTTNVFRGEASERLLGRSGTFTVRPERVALVPDGAAVPDGHLHAGGSVRDVQYLGAECRCRVTADAGVELIASVPPDGLAGVVPGARVRVAWPAGAAFRVADSPVTTDTTTTDSPVTTDTSTTDMSTNDISTTTVAGLDDAGTPDPEGDPV